MSDYQKPTFDFFGDGNKKAKQARKNTKMSKKQEKLIVNTGSKGRLTPGSGNKHIKGDVWKEKSNPYNMGKMYEAKTTEGKSIKVQLEYLRKLEKEARRFSKEPVFVFGFEGLQLLNTNWGAVPIDRLEELFEIERKYYEKLEED